MYSRFTNVYSILVFINKKIVCMPTVTSRIYFLIGHFLISNEWVLYSSINLTRTVKNATNNWNT